MESDYFAEFPPEMTHMTSCQVGYGPPRCDIRSRRWKKHHVRYPRCSQGKEHYMWLLCYKIYVTFRGVQHILFWKPIKSNTGIHDVSKRRQATLFGFARSPSSPGLVSSVVLSMCFAWMWFCISRELFCKIRTLNNLPPAVYCGQHQNTHVVELIVPITLL